LSKCAQPVYISVQATLRPTLRPKTLPVPSDPRLVEAFCFARRTRILSPHLSSLAFLSSRKQSFLSFPDSTGLALPSSCRKPSRISCLPFDLQCLQPLTPSRSLACSAINSKFAARANCNTVNPPTLSAPYPSYIRSSSPPRERLHPPSHTCHNFYRDPNLISRQSLPCLNAMPLTLAPSYAIHGLSSNYVREHSPGADGCLPHVSKP
jgi:hypothetical protein